MSINVNNDISLRDAFHKEMSGQLESCRSNFKKCLNGKLFSKEIKNVDYHESMIDFFLAGNDHALEEEASFLLSQKVVRVSKENAPFCEFFKLATETIAELTDEDIPTLVSDNPSPTAKKVCQLFQMLKKYGFVDVDNRPFAFWSGKAARAILEYPDRILIDTRIPLYCGMMTLLESIPQDYTSLRIRFMNVIFAHLACQAKGDVKIFVSNPEGQKRHLVHGKYFWNAELPTLQVLKQKGMVTSIHFHFLDLENNKWSHAIDFDKLDDVELVRRGELEEQGTRITFGYLKKVIKKWKAFTKQSLIDPIVK